MMTGGGVGEPWSSGPRSEEGRGGGGLFVHVCNLDLMFPRGCPEFGLRSLVVLDQ